MGKKSKRIGVVYSTNDDFNYQDKETEEETTPDHSHQNLYISLDRKNRGGKDVTLIEGYKGHNKDLEALGKTLKSKCGSGGTVKDREILIQGNHVIKVFDMLIKMGYSKTKKKGGGF